MTTLQQLVQQKLPDLDIQPQFDVELAPRSYFKIGGPAEVFIEADTREKIIKLVRFCANEKITFRILAGASNVVIPSAGLPGITLSISNADYFINKGYGEGESIITVGAGYKTALLVRQTIDDGFQGLEYFLGVPGKIGGAIYNNAHYQEHLISEYVDHIEVIDRNGKLDWYSQADCDFRYDHSRFQNSGDVILRIEFTLTKGDKTKSLNRVREATVRRAETQPLGEPSSGCYFRNVPNTPELQQEFPQFKDKAEFPAAFLIDHAGLKGQHIGGIKVSEKHAAFFVNTGNGTSDEVKQLAALVKQKVIAKYGIELKPEVFWLE